MKPSEIKLLLEADKPVDEVKLKAAIEAEIGHFIEADFDIHDQSGLVGFKTRNGNPWYCKITSTGKLKKNSCRVSNY